MAYGIESVDGRYRVSSPKGKLWKTSYPSRSSAEKAVAYIEGRFSPTTAPSSPEIEFGSDLEGDHLTNNPDTKNDRIRLGIPPKKTEGEEDTGGW